MNLRDQQAAETRQRFIDAAFELFSEQGYGASSMNQIAKLAGRRRAAERKRIPAPDRPINS